MTRANSSRVKTLALFEQRVAGDESLMKLAGRRFQQAAIGAEMHGGNKEDLESVLSFRPFPEAPVIFHLPREFNLAELTTQHRILDLASHFSGRVTGFVVHDHWDLVKRPAEYLQAAQETNAALEKIDQSPILFIEYAAGVPPSGFTGFFRAIQAWPKVSTCIDVGHAGIRAARHAFERRHPGQDLCSVKSRPDRLPQLMSDINEAVRVGKETTIELIGEISKLNKPLHFHLHDGHPLSTFSPFGVADHLGFLTEIPLAFEYGGRCAVSTMFGPEGLSQIVSRALSSGSAPVSFTLEIHPTGQRQDLGEAASMFAHWTDKTNAEKMNHWLSLLIDNHQLLTNAIRDCMDKANT